MYNQSTSIGSMKAFKGKSRVEHSVKNHLHQNRQRKPKYEFFKSHTKGLESDSSEYKKIYSSDDSDSSSNYSENLDYYSTSSSLESNEYDESQKDVQPKKKPKYNEKPFAKLLRPKRGKIKSRSSG